MNEQLQAFISEVYSVDVIKEIENSLENQSQFEYGISIINVIKRLRREGTEFLFSKTVEVENKYNSETHEEELNYSDFVQYVYDNYDFVDKYELNYGSYTEQLPCSHYFTICIYEYKEETLVFLDAYNYTMLFEFTYEGIQDILELLNIPFCTTQEVDGRIFDISGSLLTSEVIVNFIDNDDIECQGYLWTGYNNNDLLNLYNEVINND